MASVALQIERAISHLRTADPVMAALVDALGPIQPRPPQPGHFEALCRAIVYQQLSGRAASTIFSRLRAHFGDGSPFPQPAEILRTPPEQLRAAGLSRQKIASLHSLAEHFVAGDLDERGLDHWPDEEVIAHLTRVRGIGRWTAEMFLIFQLHRPDVLPVGDLGINRAIMKRYRLASMPRPEQVRAIGAPWRPHATVACLYLWRSEDTALPA